MISATLSSKYQLAIPKAIREELGLQAGRIKGSFGSNYAITLDAKIIKEF